MAKKETPYIEDDADESARALWPQIAAMGAYGQDETAIRHIAAVLRSFRSEPPSADAVARPVPDDSQASPRASRETVLSDRSSTGARLGDAPRAEPTVTLGDFTGPLNSREHVLHRRCQRAESDIARLQRRETAAQNEVYRLTQMWTKEVSLRESRNLRIRELECALDAATRGLWRQDEIDAVKWRAQQRAERLGLRAEPLFPEHHPALCYKLCDPTFEVTPHIHTPAGVYVVEVETVTIIDPSSPEGQQMIRNSAFERPVTEGDPPPAEDREIRVVPLDDPSVPYSLVPVPPPEDRHAADLRSDWRSANHSMMCEAHPGRAWPHDDCAGPGMPWIIEGRTLITELLRAAACDAPPLDAIRDAGKLAASEQHRWAGVNNRTSQHWEAVATALAGFVLACEVRNELAVRAAATDSVPSFGGEDGDHSLVPFWVAQGAVDWHVMYRTDVAEHPHAALFTSNEKHCAVVSRVLNALFERAAAGVGGAGLDNEVCICAAVKMGELIIRGHRHDDCLRTLDDRIKHACLERSPIVQGFITSRNRFVGREEGMQLQKAAGVKSAYRDGEELRGTILFSEDLY